MKLRSIISLGAVAGLALSAAANYESPNTFGILALNDSTSTNLIISVPWVDCTNGSEATLVSNVVKTTNLADGDYLIYKVGNTYNSWVLEGSVWKPQAIVISKAGAETEVYSTAAADGLRVSRGSALWLHRANPAASKPVYLFGQYTTAEATTTITVGQTTLAANPGDSALNLNSGFAEKWTSGAPANGDKILVNLPSGYRTYTYNASAAKWQYVERTQGSSIGGTLPRGGSGAGANTINETTKDAESIPAGQGFWYQSKTGAGTINW